MAKPIEKVYQVRENVSIGVKIAGEGEPVIFLHDERGLTWDPFLEELSNHYKVYAPHMPGTSSSSGIESIRDLWDLILCYYDLFDALEMESAHVIGHSLGGMIAAELAATDQSRVKKLVTIAPFGLYRNDLPIPDLYGSLENEVNELYVLDQNSPVAEMLRFKSDDLDETMEAMIHKIQNQQAAAKFLWPIPDKKLSSRIHRIQAPTLIIWGKQDALINIAYAEDFHNKIADSKLKVIDNASHLVQLEQKSQVIKEINQFLTASVAVR